MVKYVIFLCVLAGAFGCSNVYRKVYTNYDRSVDFGSYTTFAWAPDSGQQHRVHPDEGMAAYDNDIVRNNAKNYITNALTERGFLVNIDSPDLVLRLVLFNEKKEQIVTYRTSPNMGYYYYSPYYFPYYYPFYRYYTWYGWGYPPYYGDEHVTTTVKTYVKGTITINVYDRETRKLIWTGSAEGNIYDPSYIHYSVHPAVDRIMKEFPIKPMRKEKRKDEIKPIVRNGNALRTFDAPH